MVRTVFVGGPLNGKVEHKSTCPDRVIVSGENYSAVKVDFEGAIYVHDSVDKERWVSSFIDLIEGF